MKAPVAGSKEAQVRMLRELRAVGRRMIKTDASSSKPFIAPVQASAPSQETIMSKKSKKAAVKSVGKKRSVSDVAANLKAAKKATPKTKAKTDDAAPKEAGAVRAGSKLALVVGLLTRPEGCTAAEIMALTLWPSVSVPQQAKAAGLTLRKEKDGKVSRYFGAAAA